MFSCFDAIHDVTATQPDTARQQEPRYPSIHPFINTHKAAVIIKYKMQPRSAGIARQK